MSRSRTDTDGLVIGLDAGGTSTRAVLLTRSGDCLGYGGSGSGNPTSAGEELAGASVVDAVQRALAAAGRDVGEVSGIVAAMAGHGARGGAVRWLEDALSQAGYRGELEFESDLLALYFSGTASPGGYAIVSGTGAAAIRVEDGELSGTVDGLGWLLGDRGSGFWIGHHVALAAVEDLDGRGPATALTAAVLEALDVVPGDVLGYGRPASLEALIRTVYRLRPVELSRLAPLAFAAAEEDAQAQGILTRAGELLAASFAAIHRGPGPLVTGGSVLAQPGLLADAFTAGVEAVSPGVERIPVADGVVGAGHLALRHAGAEPDAGGHAALTVSIAAARAGRGTSAP
ncbi:MAG: BadF/BadG/BcrA/BcrD ATPase family protein [Microbacterium sp.]